MIADRKDRVQYLTTTKGCSDDCTCSSPEHNIALNDLHYGSKRMTFCLKDLFLLKMS